MRAIQHYLPNPRHVEVMRIFVNAKPQVAWNTARHIDLSTIHWVRFLFDLRTFADLFHHEANQHETNHRLGIDQITNNGGGFHLLFEEDQKQVVVGAIGKFWHLQIPFIQVDSNHYRDFNLPGWGKVAWSITVEPYLHGSTICLELRTTATDEESWKKLNRYYHFIGVFSNLIRRTGMKRMEKELEMMELPDDKTRRLAGDEILGGANYSMTDAVSIEAPPAIVWRYLMQLGCDRGGWYSIDFLDNDGIASTNHLVAEWTDRNLTERIDATPKKDKFFEVWQIETEKHFVIGGKNRTRNGIFKMSWSFVLEPIGDDATHLVVRAKMIMSQRMKEWFMGNIIYPPVHGLMEFVQLKTIKRYAERVAQERSIVEANSLASFAIENEWK